MQLGLIISSSHMVRSDLHLDSEATVEGRGREGGEECELREAEEIWVTLEAIIMV